MEYRKKWLKSCLLAVLLPGLALTTLAQDKGIQFEKGLSWAQIKEKAKKENKFIFMDCYATWCAPCKLMSDSLFPKKEVGDLFNEKFINVKVQLDKTARDNEEIKSWYTDAAAIAVEYKVIALPTFLYFSPDGKLVHMYSGATTNPQEFIAVSEQALTPSSQYFTRMEQAMKQAGNDAAKLKNLALQAKRNNDGISTKALTDAYLDLMKDVYTKEHLMAVEELTTQYTDKGFRLFREQADKVNATMGRGYAEMKVAKLVLLGTGSLDILMNNSEPDFTQIEKKIKAVVPDLTERLMGMLKLHYYIAKQDMVTFLEEIKPYLKTWEAHPYPDELIGYAKSVMFTNHSAAQAEAVNWSAIAISVNPSYENMAVHSSVLYMAGKKEEAIATLEKAIEKLGKEKGEEFFLVNTYKETLEEMKSGKL